MFPITSCGVAPVRSIWLTVPALAIVLVTALPAASLAVTASL